MAKGLIILGMHLIENIKIAFINIRSNWIRSVITCLIIAFGIMALVGILTAIDAILASMTSSFSGLGANTFTIDRLGAQMSGFRRGRQMKLSNLITYREAVAFKRRFNRNALVSMQVNGYNLATIRFMSNKTNPNISVIGVDENYLAANGYDLAAGRNFSTQECEESVSRAIIGYQIAIDLFEGDVEKALNATIQIQSSSYQVIGVLKSKGSSFNQSSDRVAIIPITLARQRFLVSESNFPITVYVPQLDQLNEIEDYSISLFRNIRGLRPGEENDFEISRSDNIINILKENTLTIRAATIGIGLITLIGAAVGLMNIMLVSVNERTREIGLRKSLGANKKHILIQFLTETIILCQLGGTVGILLGILVGNLVSLATGESFFIPWLWIMLGFSTCFIIGLASGIIPAIQAANLDPIEALRNE